MSYKQKLGYTNVRADKVVRRASMEITRMLSERERELDEFLVQTQKMLNKRFFHKLLKRPPVTRDQARQWLEDDDFESYVYYSLTPEFVTDRQRGLQTLIDVGNDMMKVWPQATMELAIEVADWLVLR